MAGRILPRCRPLQYRPRPRPGHDERRHRGARRSGAHPLVPPGAAARPAVPGRAAPALAVSTTAVIVTFNRRDHLAGCLDAIAAQTMPVASVVVVDNASTDGTPEYLRRRGYLDRPGLRLERLPVNGGGAGGFSHGVAGGPEGRRGAGRAPAGAGRRGSGCSTTTPRPSPPRSSGCSPRGPPPTRAPCAWRHSCSTRT